MTIRKFVAAVLLCLALSAQSGVNADESLKGKHLKIAEVAWGLDDIFFQTVQDGIVFELDRLGKEDGFTFKRDLKGSSNPDTQVKLMETMMAIQPDFGIYCTIDSKILGPVLRYNQAGIPVITNNVTVLGGKHTFVAFDNYIAGQQCAKSMIKLLKKRYGETPEDWAKAGGVIVEITGELSTSIAQDRGRGFHSVMDPICEKTPGLEIATVEGKWKPDLSYQRMSDMITKYGDKIIGTYTHDDTMSIAGIWPALEAAGMAYTWDQPKHIPMVGIDATTAALKMVRAKKVDSITIQPAWGEGVVVARLIKTIAEKGEAGIAKAGDTLYADVKKPLIMDIAPDQFTKEELEKGAKPVWAPVHVVEGKTPGGSWDGVWYKTSSTMTVPGDYAADSKLLWGNFWPYIRDKKWPWDDEK